MMVCVTYCNIVLMLPLLFLSYSDRTATKYVKYNCTKNNEKYYLGHSKPYENRTHVIHVSLFLRAVKFRCCNKNTIYKQYLMVVVVSVLYAIFIRIIVCVSQKHPKRISAHVYYTKKAKTRLFKLTKMIIIYIPIT